MRGWVGGFITASVLAIAIMVSVAVFSQPAHAGEWMGWRTYCHHHHHYAQTHKVCKPYR